MGLGPIIVYSNDDLLLTLTYIMTMSNLVSYALKLGLFICIIGKVTRDFVLTSKFYTQWVSCPLPGAMYMHMHKSFFSSNVYKASVERLQDYLWMSLVFVIYVSHSHLANGQILSSAISREKKERKKEYRIMRHDSISASNKITLIISCGFFMSG